jgi:hypothetical protein
MIHRYVVDFEWLTSTNAHNSRSITVEALTAQDAEFQARIELLHTISNSNGLKVETRGVKPVPDVCPRCGGREFGG